MQIPVNIKPALSLFLSIALALSLPLRAQKLNIKNYTADDGLPQSQVLDIIQDHTGALWIATNGGGAASFDGTKFTSITTRDGLNNNHLFAVFEDARHRIWLGTARGLNVWEKKQIRSFGDTLVSQVAIHTIHQHSNGQMWFGTDNGIVIFNGKKFSRLTSNDALATAQVWSIKEDKYGNTWFATLLGGVFCYDGKKVTHFGTAEGLNDLKNRDLLISGNQLLVTTYHGVNVLDLSKPIIGGGRVFDTLKINGKPYLQACHRLYKDASGIIWIGNNNGVTKIENNHETLITKSNGLCSPLIDAILQDKEGNLWFGSFGGGMSKEAEVRTSI